MLTRNICTGVDSCYMSIWYMAEVASEISYGKTQYKTNYAGTMYNQCGNVKQNLKKNHSLSIIDKLEKTKHISRNVEENVGEYLNYT